VSDGTKIEWTESVRRAGDHHELIDFERARVAASRVSQAHNSRSRLELLQAKQHGTVLSAVVLPPRTTGMT